MATDAVWNGGMGTLAYLLERRKGKGGSIEDGATRHGEVQRAAQRTRGKPRFPAAVTEVLQPSLSCVHGLRLQVFCRRHMSSNGLVCHARFGKSRARRFGGRKHVADGNGRRCRFTLAVSCIRWHSRLPTEAKKGKNDKTVSAVQHKHIKEVSTTIAVSLVTLWSSWAFLCLCRF